MRSIFQIANLSGPRRGAGICAIMPWLPVLVGAVLAVAAYLQALHYPFIADDIIYIVSNRPLAELQLTELWKLLTQPYNSFLEFLPLRDLSYWFDLQLFGQDPTPYRLHNILLYVLCLLPLYATSVRLWGYFYPADADSAPWVAAVITTLFAIHPALVESVVWIAGRKYILADFFSLLALWLAVSARQGAGLSSRYAAATLIVFVCVMFSKSSYVGVAPVIAMLWLRFWLDAAPSERCRTLLLWVAAILALAAVLLLVFIVNDHANALAPLYLGIEAVTRSLAILGGLAGLAVTPEARHYFYPLFEDSWFPLMTVQGFVMLIAGIWGGVAFLRKRSFAGFALVSFLLLCLPYLQPVPTMLPSLIQDRYVALAIWPVLLLVVFLARRLKPVPRAVLLLFLVLPWTFQTMKRPNDWRNDETLIRADYRACPECYMPAFFMVMDFQMRNGLYREAIGTASNIKPEEISMVMLELIKADYARRVEAASSGKPDRAVSLLLNLERMLEHPPRQSQWDTPMLNLWKRLFSSLTDQWQALAASFPDNVSVRYNAAAYELRMHDYGNAIPNLRAAAHLAELPPSLRGSTYFNLGAALINTGRPDEAIAPLNAALQQFPPERQAYCALARAYKMTGSQEDAAHAAEKCTNNK